MNWWYAVVAGLFGLMFGSAINAFVWRLKVGRSWVHGRSECPDCGHVLAAKDLVPVASWLALGGKCRYCRKPIKDHPVVELVTAAAFVVSVYVLMPTNTVGWVRLGFWLVALVMLITLAVYDARWLLLPNKVTYPLIGVALIYAATMAVMLGSPVVLERAVEAAVLAGTGFYALVYFSQGRAMGGGDIKLAVAMGLLLGVKGTALALLVAFNVAAIVGLSLILTHQRGRRDQIPFGPYLVLGTMLAFWFSEPVVAWYLRWNGLG